MAYRVAINFDVQVGKTSPYDPLMKIPFAYEQTIGVTRTISHALADRRVFVPRTRTLDYLCHDSASVAIGTECHPRRAGDLACFFDNVLQRVLIDLLPRY